MMTLTLQVLPATINGIYDCPDGRKKCCLPARARYLDPDAAKSFLTLDRALDDIDSRLRVSDMFRWADVSLAAVRAGRGAMPPAFSGHNYGLSIDIDVSYVLKTAKAKIKNKDALDELMEDFGWHCHRVDAKRDHEEWHYNYGISKYVSLKDKSTAPALERALQERLGEQFKLTAEEAQRILSKLNFYSGKIDGDAGPLTRQAVEMFQRGYGIWERKNPTWVAEHGKLGPVTQRTLAYVGAKLNILAEKP